MNIILLERIEKLGQIGDLVTVKSGYARNFLLPQGKAVFASKENIKIFEDKNIPDFEIEIRNKAVLRLNISIYLDKNNLFFDEVCCVLFIRDLTEFHKFQQLKSDFVANVSHELRTPLQSIKMGLETIDNIKDLKENNELNNLMPLMTSQSERMENLIRDLLSLSKIELQEHIRPTHEIDLIELIDYVIKTYEKIISKNNISIKFNKTDNFKIIGDRDKLIEIFTNSCQFIEAPAVIVQPSTDSSLSMYLTQSSATDSLKIELVFSPRITAFSASIDCSFCFRSAAVTSK